MCTTMMNVYYDDMYSFFAFAVFCQTRVQFFILKYFSNRVISTGNFPYKPPTFACGPREFFQTTLIVVIEQAVNSYYIMIESVLFDVSRDVTKLYPVNK